MSWSTSTIVAVASLVVLGCQPRADSAAEREALRAADVAFARATAESGADGWVSYFAEDGVMFRPGGAVVGQDSILAMVTAWFADDAFTLAWEPQHAEVSKTGDLGYTYGRYRSTGRDSMNNQVTGTGSYVTVWRKQPDGTWKVALDIGSPDGR